MDPDLRRRMLAYYDERAPEYEEAYTLGTGTASIPDTSQPRTESTRLVEVPKAPVGSKEGFLCGILGKARVA